MPISGIGIQQILPRSGTGWKSANPPRDATDDQESNQASARTPDRGPTAPGTGRIVDKIA